MFLSSDEVAHITGSLNPDAQAKWLDHHRWKYQRSSVNGDVLVYILERSRRALAYEVNESQPEVLDILRRHSNRSWKRSSTFIYVIGMSGHDRPVKVGFATDLKSRLCGLQVGNPVILEVRATYTAWSSELAKEVEQFVHANFASQRLVGEWFDVTADEVSAWIDVSCSRLPIERNGHQ